MEGEVRVSRLGGIPIIIILAALSILPPPAVHAAQETPPEGAEAEISLRKTVNTKKFQGQDVEGEDRLISRGDSLWRILVEEKGLPGQKFPRYIVVIRGLNPQIKNLDVLRIGDKVFIPLRPDEALEGKTPSRIAPDRGVTTEYRVKAGEHLFQILREQLKVTDERRLGQYYALVKDLNPERKDWDRLLEGDILRLPTTGVGQENLARRPAAVAKQGRGAEAVASLDATSPGRAQSGQSVKTGADSASATAMRGLPAGKGGDPAAPAKAAPVPEPSLEAKPAAKTVSALPSRTESRQALDAPAHASMVLFANVVESLGGELQQSGEEVVALRDQTVRFDKSKYPVVYSPALRQRVVIDPDDKIPASLRKQLGDPDVRTPVLSMDNGVSLQEAVRQLLARLGYQSLPAERPVIIHEEGIAYEARGDWMALGPEVSNRTQEIFVINLTENPHEIPEYLKAQLAKRGLHLREVIWPPANAQARREPRRDPITDLTQVKTWPRAKEEMIDAMLFSFGVPFGVAETFTVQLRDGLRVDARTDRVFDIGGKRTALFFQPGDPAVRKALSEQKGFRTEDLNLVALTSRELIAKLLGLLGDQAAYREHRFPVAHDSGRDRLTVKAWGFQLSNQPLFVTDRPIPTALHHFFFERGLGIVYFQ